MMEHEPGAYSLEHIATSILLYAPSSLSLSEYLNSWHFSKFLAVHCIALQTSICHLTDSKLLWPAKNFFCSKHLSLVQP
jgi:hypothetical protein